MPRPMSGRGPAENAGQGFGGPHGHGGGPPHGPGNPGPNEAGRRGWQEDPDWQNQSGPEGFAGPGRQGGPGPGGFGGPGWRGRARRGAIRSLILAALTEKPMHGYEVIGALEGRSGRRWRPSAGSVYPTLQSFEDEGLVTSEELDGKRVYALTDAGREAAATSSMAELWTDDEDEDGLREAGAGLIGAVTQIDRVGSGEARTEAIRILTDARRNLYRLLAFDEPEAATPAGPGQEAEPGQKEE